MTTEALSKTSPLPLKLQGPLGGVIIVVVSLLVCIPLYRAIFVLNDHDLARPTPTSLLAGPKTWMSPDKVALWAQWRAFHANPLGYHVVSALLHAAAALLLWRVLARLDVQAALLAALIFAVHPVNTETLAWVAQQKSILAFLFLLLGLLAWLKHEDTRKPNWYFTACLAFLLAFLSNPLLVAFPLVLPLLAWWRRGKIDKADVLRAIPLLPIAVAAAFLCLHGLDSGPSAPAGRLADVGSAVWFSIQKAIVPTNLSLVYEMPQAANGAMRIYLPLAGLVGLLVGLWALQDTLGRGLFVAFAGYLLILAPGLFWPDAFRQYAVAANHWQYAALAFLAAGIVGVLARIVAALSANQKLMLGGLCVVALGGMAALRADVYQSDESLWTDVMDKNPSGWLGHTQLARIRLGQARAAADPVDLERRTQDAFSHLQKALRDNPHALEARTTLADAYLARARWRTGTDYYAQAASAYRQAIAEAPAHPDVYKIYMKLGWVLLQLQEGAKAHDATEQAIAHVPVGLDRATQAQLRWQLGKAAEMQDRLAEAVEQYTRAVALTPSDPEVRTILGTAIARQARSAQTPEEKQKLYALALAQLEAAVKLPGDPRPAADALADVQREWRATTAPATTQSSLN